MKPRFALTLAILVLGMGLHAGEISFTDGSGVVVRLAGPARRVVSLSPALTENLYAAGAGAVLVGNTTYCNHPRDADGKPKVGGFAARTISLEKILSLDPDLVVGDLSTHGSLADRLRSTGLVVALFDLRDFGDVYAAIERLGAVAGDVAVAASAVSRMRARIESVAAGVAKLPRSARPVVFWETWDDPLMTAGPNTFTGLLIEIAGGRNVFADASQDWPIVGFEEIVRRNPDIIMGSDTHGTRMTPERLASRPGWAALSAVKAGRVVLLDGDIVSRAGPRLADAAELMASAIAAARVAVPGR